MTFQLKNKNFVSTTIFNLMVVSLIAIVNRYVGMPLHESAFVSAVFFHVTYQILKAEGMSIFSGSVFTRFTVICALASAILVGLVAADAVGIN